MALWVSQTVNNLPAMQISARFLGQEDSLKGKGTCSSVLAWRIPWTEEPGGLQSMGSQRVRHDLVTIHTHTALWATTALLPFSHGRRYKISKDTWNVGQEKRVPTTEQEDVGPGHHTQPSASLTAQSANVKFLFSTQYCNSLPIHMSPWIL